MFPASPQYTADAFWIPLIKRVLKDASGAPKKPGEEIMQEVRAYRQAGHGQYPDPETIDLFTTGMDEVPF